MQKRLRYIVVLLFTACIFCFISPRAYAAVTSQRLQGSDKYQTAVAVSKAGWPNGADNVVLATGEDYPDALSAAPFAKKNNAPILLSTQDKLNTDTANELKRLKVKQVYIIGGTGVISNNVEAQLKLMGFKTTRIAGADRYDTSIQLAQKVGMNTGCFLVTGDDYADAISAAPIAAKLGYPVILTSYELPSSVSKFIGNKSKSKVYVVGDSSTISDDVLLKLSNAERIDGYDKYDRNANLINAFAQDLNFSKVYLSTGNNFPDALAASVLAAYTSSPVILSDYSLTQSSEDLIRSKVITEIAVLGGTGAVSTDVENRAKSLPASIKSLTPIYMQASEKEIGKNYQYPKTVTAVINDGSKQEIPVAWDLSSVNTSNAGEYIYSGKVDGYSGRAYLYLTIKPDITSVDNIKAEVVQNSYYTFPSTANVKYSDNSYAELPITWASTSIKATKLGSFTFQGQINGSDKKVSLTLKVVEDATVNFSNNSQLLSIIKRELGKSSSTTIYKSDILSISSLQIGTDTSYRVSTLSGFDQLTNLEYLEVKGCGITDISPLQNLTNLRVLNLKSNRIENIAPLQKLTRLEYLDLSSNRITNIVPLKGLTKLSTLYLKYNYNSTTGAGITDYSPINSYYNRLNSRDFNYDGSRYN